MKYEVDEFRYLTRNLSNKIYMARAGGRVDLVQCGGSWLKFRFARTKRTYVLDRDDLRKAGDAGIDTDAVAKAINGKFKTAACVKVPDAYNMTQVPQMLVRKFDEAVETLERSENQQYPALVGQLEWLNETLFEPTTAAGLTVHEPFYVKTDKGFAGVLNNTRALVPGSELVVFEKAVEPLCWFGKPLLDKPVSSLSEVNKFEAPLGNLEELIEEERR